MSYLFETIRYYLMEVLLIVPNIFWITLNWFLPKNSKNISGQLALITGGSEGIGRAIAFRLAQEGCNLAIANRNIEKGQKTAEEIRKKFNVKVQAFQCDVSKCEEVKRLKDEVKKSLGTVDLLVNNAGLLSVDHSVLEGDDEYYQYCMDVNLTSYIWTTRTFLPDMIKQRRGHLIAISSLTTKFTFAHTVTYTTTKFGNKAFMDALREDMCQFGFDKFIKISSVIPGFVRTNDGMVDTISENFLETVFMFKEPEYAADQIVKGILKDEENIWVSWIEFVQVKILNSFSRPFKNILLKNAFKSSKRDEFIKNKLEKCKLLDAY
ncbi:uncharacterized oxidoreductase SSP0419-like [Chironomus tepperi]|uniref:uncharacterized oxidoreductase SSP0419-like n=1 Tax=Chironomus tepperi TaxID=113505 RepID=UPI00391F0AE2